MKSIQQYLTDRDFQSLINSQAAQELVQLQIIVLPKDITMKPRYGIIWVTWWGGSIGSYGNNLCLQCWLSILTRATQYLTWLILFGVLTCSIFRTVSNNRKIQFYQELCNSTVKLLQKNCFDQIPSCVLIWAKFSFFIMCHTLQASQRSTAAANTYNCRHGYMVLLLISVFWYITVACLTISFVSFLFIRVSYFWVIGFQFFIQSQQGPTILVCIMSYFKGLTAVSNIRLKVELQVLLRLVWSEYKGRDLKTYVY